MSLQTSRFLVRFGLWVRRALIALADRIVPPHLAVFERSIGISHTMLLGIAADLKLADIVSERKVATATLAKDLQIAPDILERVVNALVARGFFRYRADRTLVHTRLSKALRSGQSEATSDWARYFASQSNASAWVDLPRSLRHSGSPFDRVHGMNVWDWFSQNPDEEETFARSMMGVTRIHAPIILSLYSFETYKVICDIGGGRGTLLSFILKEYPHLKAILLDAPGVLDSARVHFKEQGLRENRVQFISGNFFDTIPPGAECYLLKNILHDWNDETCLHLLKRIGTQMNSSQKLLIIEQILAEETHDFLQTFSDIQMHVACSDGRERTARQLTRLLQIAGFKASLIKTHPLIGVIEARLAD